ncbi:MAG: hypothetical protein AAF514_22640, partial [Verrucomicrobiota bacterium]
MTDKFPGQDVRHTTIRLSEQAMVAGRFDEAATHLEQCLLQHLDDPGLLARLAICRSQSPSQKPVAQDCLRRLFLVTGDNSWTYRLCAAVRLDLDEGDDALEAARRAVSLEPDQAMSHALAAEAHRQLHQASEAETQASLALSLDPCQELAPVVLARIAGDLLPTEKWISRMLADDPENHQAHWMAGLNQLLRRKNAPEASNHFSETLRLNPNHPQAEIALTEAQRSTFRPYHLNLVRTILPRLRTRLLICRSLSLLLLLALTLVPDGSSLLQSAFGAAAFILFLWNPLHPIGTFYAAPGPGVNPVEKRRTRLKAMAFLAGFVFGISGFFLPSVWFPAIGAGCLLLSWAIPENLRPLHQGSICQTSLIGLLR